MMGSGQAADPTYGWREEWYEGMPIDHFSYADPRTFRLRYLINDTWFEPGGPILFYCGNEGYILSRRGASKLIDQVSEDGFLGDVDWRMVTYSLERRDIMGLSEQHFARMAMAVHLEAIAARAPLVSFTSSIGLIGLTQTGSSREAQNIGRHFHESFNDTGNPF